MSKIKLYKNSPLNKIGQGINDRLAYNAISKSNTDLDYTKEALFDLGVSLSQMDFGKEKEPTAAVESASEKDFAQSLLDNTADPMAVNTDLSGDYFGRFLTKEQLEIPDLVSNSKKPLKTQEVVQKVLPPVLEEAINEKGEVVLVPKEVYYDNGIDSGSRMLGGSAVIQNVDLRKQQQFDFSRGFPRLNPEIRANLENLKYNVDVNGDSPLRRMAHSYSSPFLKTDKTSDDQNVDFRYMKRLQASKFSKLGGASAEGYNAVIDAQNYKAAVKADYDKELGEQMGDLVVGLDEVNPNYNKDMQALLAQKKTELAAAWGDYNKGNITKLEYENSKSSLMGDVNNIAIGQNNLKAVRADFIENKGLYDLDASKPQMLSFYNTLEQNPDSFTIKNIGGVDYYSGKTLQGDKVEIAVSKIANGTAGFKLVKTYDANKAINGAIKAINNVTKEGKTDLGVGTMTLDPNNPEEAEELRKIGVANILKSIGSNEADLRSLFAQKNFGDYNIFQSMLGSPENKAENIEGMRQQLAQEIYNEDVLPLYSQKTQTKRFKTINPPKASTSTQERVRQANITRLNQLGKITPDNIMDFDAEIDQSKYTLRSDGSGGYVVADKKGNQLASFDFSDQSKVKSTMLNFMKSGGGFNAAEYISNFTNKPN